MVGCGQWYNRENEDTRQFLMGTQATRTRLGGQTRVHQIYFQIYNSIAMKQKPDVLHSQINKVSRKCALSPLRGLLSLSGRKIKKNLWDQGTSSHEPLQKSLLLIHATGGWGTPLFRPNGHVPLNRVGFNGC